jgi:hypothetical protein
MLMGVAGAASIGQTQRLDIEYAFLPLEHVNSTESQQLITTSPLWLSKVSRH